jgi:hypothetical protein
MLFKAVAATVIFETNFAALARKTALLKSLRTLVENS